MEANDLIKASLSLFNAMPIKNKNSKRIPNIDMAKVTMKRGITFSPSVYGNYTDVILMQFAKDISLSGDQINSSFHKSWDKVANASMQQLVAEQLIHYFTTYGLELFGIVDESSVDNPYIYLPVETLNIPDTVRIQLKIIVGLTIDEIKEKCLFLLRSGIALKQETLDDIITIFKITKLNQSDLVGIRNREFLVVLYDSFNMLPEAPDELLRYIIYKTTASTLLIKDRKTMELIKLNNREAGKYLLKFVDKFGIEKLSTMFFRFKPLWLAMKNRDTSSLINKARKLAEKNNVPAKPQMLDSLTSTEETLENIGLAISHMKNITIWRKFRIAQALNYRLRGCESIVYKIRNGKMFSSELERNNVGKMGKLAGIGFLNAVLGSIKNDLLELKGKKVYIPPNIKYALPTSEKQFVGNIPAGSSVSINENAIFGVWWKNTNRRIDLDLKMLGLDFAFGWDAGYRDGERNVLFSGDHTDGGNGVSEMFYIGKGFQHSTLFTLNYFNYSENSPVPGKLFLAKEPNNIRINKNYMVNPENVVIDIPFTVEQQQNVLGFISKDENNNITFYFIDGKMGQSISSRVNKYTSNTIKYLTSYYNTMISLKDVLTLAEVEFVHSPNEADVDLSIENLDKTTILNLFK